MVQLPVNQQVARNSQSNEVTEWLENVVGLPEYVPAFNEQRFTALEDVARITPDHLVQVFDIQALGHRLRMERCIADLNKANNSGAPDVADDSKSNDAPISQALVTDFMGNVYNAILTKGGTKSSKVRDNVNKSIAAVRFDAINNKTNDVGQKVNTGHFVTKRALISLSNYGLVTLSNVQDPRTRVRTGRGGSQWWTADVRRISLSVAYRGCDEDEQDELKQFITKYKSQVSWRNYVLACGDYNDVQQLGLAALYE